MAKKPERERQDPNLGIFLKLFLGSLLSYGTWDAKRGAKTVKSAPTPSHYVLHLAGKLGLGIVPVREDGTCRFAAIDIDVDTIDHAFLYAEVKRRRMPLTVCRSKSGGAHVYVFFSEPGLPASLVREKLRRFATALGFPNAEIFPKQNEINGRRLGNWINLPYFASDKTTRYAVGEKGALSLDEFLASVEFVASAERLDDVDLTPAPSVEPEPTPAPKTTDGKIREGARNSTLFVLACRVLPLAGLNATKALVRTFDLERCEPSLGKELDETIFKTLARRWEESKPQIKEVRPLNLVSVMDLLNRKTENDVMYVVRGLVPGGGYIILIGRPKVGKSLSVHELSYEVAAGLPVFGSFQVREAMRVAYVDFAQSDEETRCRTAQMMNGYPECALAAENLFIMTKNDLRLARAFARELADIGNPRALEFTDQLVKHNIRVLCIAEIRTLVGLGLNLKDQEVAEAINAWVEWLQTQIPGITVIAVHHARKSRGETGETESFGSTMLTAAPDAIFNMKRLSNGLRRIHVEARFDAPEDFYLALQPVGNGGQLLRVAADPDEVLNEQIWKHHQDGKSSRQIARELDGRLSHVAIQGRINDLAAQREAAQAQGNLYAGTAI